MKSYTDIEQSKKLAEILPLESADMHYSNICPKGVMYSNAFEAGMTSYKDAVKMNQENIDFYLRGTDYKGIIAWEIIPCWSLSALLEILKEESLEFDDGNSVSLTTFIGKWHVNMFDCLIEQTSEYDNPVDACVEAILKLHEQSI